MSINPSSTQKCARNKQASGRAYILTTLQIVGPSIHAKIVLERIRKTLCECKNKGDAYEMLQLKFINKCCLQTDLMFIFCVFQYGCFAKIILSPFGWSQSPSTNLVLFWFGLVQSHRRKNVSRNGNPPN